MVNRWQSSRIVLLLASLAVLAVVTYPYEFGGVDVESLLGLLAAGGFLLATSGYAVRGALRFAGAERPPEDVDTGRAVGKLENVLILTLVLLGAYTALGLVFTAKSIVRWQDMNSENTTYYLTGTVTNFTYSLVAGVLAHTAFGVPI